MSKEAYCEMKMKEKGLTKTAAKGNVPFRKGFNAFHQKEDKKSPKNEVEKPEIYLDILGKKLKVNQEDGGSVEGGEVPFVKGATLKFTGCGGDVRFGEVKVG